MRLLLLLQGEARAKAKEAEEAKARRPVVYTHRLVALPGRQRQSLVNVIQSLVHARPKLVSHHTWRNVGYGVGFRC